MAITN